MPYRQHDFGFTIIEVVSVLVLLGILAAVAMVRSGGPETAIRANADILGSHLRYAQSRAMAMEEPWGLSASGGTYSMFRVSGGSQQSVPLPGEAAENIGNGRWWFDALGRPHSGNDAADHAESNINISVGSLADAVTITAVTGYIP
jgi:MSHA pilin protein MshC